MGEFANDLDSFLHGEVIRARPTGPVRKLWKRARRNPVLSFALGLAAFLLIALLVYVLVTYPLIVRALNHAEKGRAEAEEITRSTNRAFSDMVDLLAMEMPGTELAPMAPGHTRGVDMGASTTGNADLVKVPSPIVRTLELHEQYFGDTAPQTVRAKGKLAGALFRNDFYPGAEHLYRQILAECSRRLGEENPTTLAMMNNLACTLNELGEVEETAELWKRSTEAAKGVLPPRSPVSLILRLNYGKFLRETGRIMEAKKILDACEKDLSGYAGDGDLNTSDPVFHLIDTRMDQWKPAVPPRPESHEDLK